MTLQSLLEDNRLKWQENTQEEILSKLLQKSHQYKLMGQRNEKLVIVFAKSHAGKTTLILNLMGVKESLLKEVTHLLRAGIQEGHSSTSTAIIYQKSDDDLFGISEKKLNDVTAETLKCKEKEFVSHLANIRKSVESGTRNTDKILYISIPKHYFSSPKDDGICISILDVPGVGTDNYKEKWHTDALLNKYMSISSLNIVICSLYGINNLRYFVAPNRDGMKKLTTGKYIVVTTRSYSPENIFSYFKQPKSERKMSFEDMLHEECESEFRRIFGDNIPTFFPVDLGDSFSELINKKLTDQDDKKYLISFRKRIFEEIISVIKEKQCNSLKGWVDELMQDEQYYTERELKELDCRRKHLIIEKSEQEKALNKRKGYRERIHRNIEAISIELSKKKEKAQSIPAPEMREEIDKKYQEIRNVNFNKDYSWKNKSIKNNIADLYTEAFSEIVEMYLQKLEDHDLNLFSKQSTQGAFMLKEDYEVELQKELDNKMYKHKGILRGLNPTIKRKIEIGEQIAEERMTMYMQSLYEQYTGAYVADIKTIMNDEYNKHSILIIEEEGKIKDIKDKLEDLKDQLNSVEESICQVNLRVEKDKETIREYRSVAKKHYELERNRIIHEMNQEKEAIRKAEYSILLGLINQDYRKVVMG